MLYMQSWRHPSIFTNDFQRLEVYWIQVEPLQSLHCKQDWTGNSTDNHVACWWPQGQPPPNQGCNSNGQLALYDLRSSIQQRFWGNNILGYDPRLLHRRKIQDLYFPIHHRDCQALRQASFQRLYSCYAGSWPFVQDQQRCCSFNIIAGKGIPSLCC